MKILSGGDIAKEVKRINPQYIAVGYIGKDWHKYIDIEFVKEIIVSPTIGSNPFAIESIVKEIGFENVYFLDELHAKLYIGSDRYAFGSFNLSANAFEADEILVEFGCIANDGIKQAKSFYEQCKNRAINRYRTVEEKELALKNLFEKHKSLNFYKNNSTFVSDDSSNRDGHNTDENFYIMVVNQDGEYDEDLLKDNNPQYRDIEDLEAAFDNYQSIVLDKEIYDGKVKLNSWVLQVDKRKKAETPYSWLFINSIAKGVNEDDDIMIIQDDLTEIPTKKPFKIDTAIMMEKIKKLLDMPKYQPLFYDISNDKKLSEQFDFDLAIKLSKEFKKDLSGL